MIFLDQVPGTHRLRTISSVGEVFPLTTTANGKACLALLPPERAQALARAESDRRGMNLDPEAFEAELAEIRETGLAFDRDEHTEGISAIGIGFHDWSGDLHAISVPVPSSRFGASEGRVRKAILKTRAHVTKLMER